MEKSVILHALLSLTLTGEDHGPPPSPPSPDCYEVLGCFPVGGVWQGVERPVSLPPMSPHLITPTFCLYTPTNPHCHVLVANHFMTFFNSSLDPSYPLLVITHGYLESVDLVWMQRMMTSLLKTSERVGVVTVDWSTAALPPYAQAVANIRLVGAMTGHLLQMLIEYYGVDSGSIHLIGHSLGSHLMGYTGQYLLTNGGHKVGRITGLDPAGPYFTNTLPEVRLDPSDAVFVDVIHTDIPAWEWEISKLGYPDAVGHVDYYPNGGTQQAGCHGSAHLHIENEKNVVGGVLSYIGCNHRRSHDYFTESVISTCQFMGVACSSWEEYQLGACWGCDHAHCAVMGFHAHPHHQEARGVNVNNTDPDNTDYPDNQGVHIDSPGVPLTFQNISRVQNGSKDGHPSVEVKSPSIKVFLGTNSEEPFCAEQYKISMVTSLTEASVKSGGDLARFTVGLRGQHGQHTVPPPERPTFVEAGGRVSWLGFSHPLGTLHALHVEYEKDHGFLHALIFRFSEPTLYVESFEVEQLSTGLVDRFPFCAGQMSAGGSYTLFPDAPCPILHLPKSTP